MGIGGSESAAPWVSIPPVSGMIAWFWLFRPAPRMFPGGKNAWRNQRAAWIAKDHAKPQGLESQTRAASSF
jgi:hypothetical protein